MFYDDHEPPHFHVHYGKRRAIAENWGRARRQVPLDAVAPLE
ncbi:MAG TPA: DUF4160 domain-containing protein [Bryobacteraceae bacterium]|nr:DUF4160 domain-containing protein [Bryobacteraceae bacterium]